MNLEAAAVGFQHVLTPKAINGIREKGDADLSPGLTDDGKGERSCEVCVLPYLAVKMWDVIGTINRQFFHFDLDGIELPQFVLYRPGDHYDWHMDRGAEVGAVYGKQNGEPARERKLSLTLQLSHSNEYAGGDLEVYDSAGIIKAKREPGAVLAFPAWTLHRVAPVTEGTRRALVIWGYGPPLR